MNEKPDIRSHQSLIEMLYVTNRLSPKMIADRISEGERKCSKNSVYLFLKEKGLLRTRKEASEVENRASRFWKAKTSVCKHCCSPFEKTNNRQRCCKACVPNKTAADRLRFYGISQIDYDRMIEEQNNACAICKKAFVELKSNAIHVDHCHKTNLVRGVICRKCNLGLSFVDDAGWLRDAIEYQSKRFSADIAVERHVV